MRSRLALAVWPAVGTTSLIAIERVVLQRWQPPLNLKDVQTPWSAGISAARRVMAAEARLCGPASHISWDLPPLRYNLVRAASLVAEWALDRSDPANGHLTSLRNGHLTFRKTGPGGPPLKRGTLGRGQAVRRLTLD